MRDRGLAGELLGERVIGRHGNKSSEIFDKAMAHPALEAVARSLDQPVSLVGGAVRHLLLGEQLSTDLDLVVEGDGVSAARKMAELLTERLVIHDRFGTATVHLETGTHLDFVTARRESYSEPGALPDVEPSTLDDDLRRRDFTINAIALRLNGPRAGELEDPVDGVSDLASRRVRFHHRRSFVDDPSRIVRAARYAARLGFTLDGSTEAAARSEAPGLDWGSGRNAEELKRMFQEPNPEAARVLLRTWGAPGLAEGVSRPDAVAISAALAAPGAPDVELWALLLGLGATGNLLDVVALPGWSVEQARGAAEGQAVAGELSACSAPSAVDALLAQRAPSAGIVAAAVGAPAVGRWWAEDRDRTLEISGTDLLDAGVMQGPAVGRGMAAARAAMLDGCACTREEQLATALAAA